jgi:putative cell wall-binding protein
MSGSSGRPASTNTQKEKPLSIRTQRNSKRGVAAVVTAALGVSLLAMSNSAGATATATSVRISGADRAATSVDASTKAAALGGAPATFNTKFVVSSSTSYADSVAAAALAGANGATIVLLPADGSLSTGAAARFTAATDVWIVGGPSAVPSSVEAAIQAASTPATIFTRLGGTNRYETAAAVASNIGSANIGLLAAKKTVILANADSFADAVSAGPAAWKGKHPVLLTPAGSLNATTKAAITASGATQVLILGGTSAISAAVASEVDAMTGVDIVRVGGANRFETASLLASVLITSVGAGGLGFSAVNVGIANLDAAGGGADALASSPYLGFANAVLLGVSSSGVPAETAAWLAANKATTTTLHVFGGTSAVADSTVSSALTSAGKLADPTATLLANEKLGTFAVIFSEPVPVANVTTAKFQVLNANASINAAWLGACPGITCASVTASGAVDGAATIFVVSVPTASTNLLAGNTIQFLGGTVAVADGRTVAGKSLVIPADTVAPVATLSATIGTAGGAANKFQVKVSEPVVTPLAAAGIFTVNGTAITPASATYTLNGTDVTAGGAFTVVGYDTAVVTTAASLGQAETLALVAGKIKDAAGNSAAAASTTVAADNVAPTVVSATAAITTTATAQLVLQSNLLVQAKTAGVAGNAVTVTVTAAAAAGAATVSVTSNAITIDTSATTTAATVKAALDASTAASALVTSTVLVPAGTFIAAGSANLAGGTSTLKLTTTYSEAVLTATGSSASYDADGAGAVVAVAGETAAPNAPVASGSTVVTTHLLTLATQLPVLNTATAGYLAGAAGDVGGNPSAAKASQIIG